MKKAFRIDYIGADGTTKYAFVPELTYSLDIALDDIKHTSEANQVQWINAYFSVALKKRLEAMGIMTPGYYRVTNAVYVGRWV